MSEEDSRQINIFLYFLMLHKNVILVIWPSLCCFMFESRYNNIYQLLLMSYSSYAGIMQVIHIPLGCTFMHSGSNMVILSG